MINMHPKPGISGKTAVFAVLAVGSLNVLAGDIRSNYQHALNLSKTTAGKVFRQRVGPNWFAGNSKFWYRNDLPGGVREFILVDAEKGTRQSAFDHTRLAEALSAILQRKVDPGRIDIGNLDFDLSGPTMSFSCEGKPFTCDLQDYKMQQADGNSVPDSSLKSIGRIRPSRRTGPETSITFVNRRDNDIDIYWVNPERQRQHYANLKPGDEHRQHTYTGHVWLVLDDQDRTLGVYEATEEEDLVVIDSNSPVVLQPRRPRRSPQSDRSPDGKWRALIENNNLILRKLDDQSERPMTEDGTPEDYYAAPFYWSPDSRKLVVLKTKKADERKVNLIESSPEDQLQPRLHTFTYAKPGDKIDQPRPHLFDIEKAEEIDVSDELFANPWSISDIRWAPDSKRFTFLYNQRGHRILRIVSVDAAAGIARPIIDERSETFIDYAGKRFSRYLKEDKEIIWMSERDGWNHLYLYDAQTGEVKNQITKGKWVVRAVDEVDEDKRQIWFRAGGVIPDQDPYYVHFCRVDFDGSNLVVLTQGNGTHRIDFSPDRRFFIDSYSRVDMPGITELRDAADGSLICPLEQADWTELLEASWRPPEPFVAKGRDGKTDIYGIIIRPSNFDPDGKYPVIEQIYAGPQGAFVPKAFGLQIRQHAIAELGFIVVQIDGMGTSQRSKAFHDVCCRNLADAGFPDRIAWIKAAAEKYPCIDTTRVGIYGGSAGGQNALGALLFHGDFYKAAVADCGCHDNRMDKIWWNELWMGWPVGPHYAEQSNVTNARNLTGKLLLTVGELDRNVDPASTMQVVDALIKADKDFDLLIVPGAGHGVGETPYAARRRMDFFVRHLLGIEPPPRQ